MRTLEKSPSKRPQNAEELLAGLAVQAGTAAGVGWRGPITVAAAVVIVDRMVFDVRQFKAFSAPQHLHPGIQRHHAPPMA